MLREYFDRNIEGFGILKWHHYFELYHRHLQKFVGRRPRVLEIGVYSGGSLGMWRQYFGADCQIYGVDIDGRCSTFQSEGVKVLIGDQADRSFWKTIRRELPQFDVVIDDGGHEPHQQIVTLEETLPYMRAGGVYVCEDIHGNSHGFVRYVNGLASNLHTSSLQYDSDPSRRIVGEVSPFQSAIQSIHLYPFVVVIERAESPTIEFVAAAHGSIWQPSVIADHSGTPTR